MKETNRVNKELVPPAHGVGNKKAATGDHGFILRPKTSELQKRLARLQRPRDRFSKRFDVRVLAIEWAWDYVNQTFSDINDDQQKLRLMIAAEASFLAPGELAAYGIGRWNHLLDVGKQAYVRDSKQCQ